MVAVAMGGRPITVREPAALVPEDQHRPGGRRAIRHPPAPTVHEVVVGDHDVHVRTVTPALPAGVVVDVEPHHVTERVVLLLAPRAGRLTLDVPGHRQPQRRGRQRPALRIQVPPQQPFAARQPRQRHRATVIPRFILRQYRLRLLGPLLHGHDGADDRQRLQIRRTNPTSCSANKPTA